MFDESAQRESPTRQLKNRVLREYLESRASENSRVTLRPLISLVGGEGPKLPTLSV